MNASRSLYADGTLQVADKAAIKEMMTLLLPPIESLGTAKKVFLTPLTRYWLKP
jgi:predicted membrane-bound spermidine synthase